MENYEIWDHHGERRTEGKAVVVEKMTIMVRDKQMYQK